jgi:hypothetical protein
MPQSTFEDTVLASIGSQEPSSFGEFVGALGDDRPSEKSEWRELFNILRQLEQHGFVEISRAGNLIDSLILTEAGANRIREKLDAGRGLLRAMISPDPVEDDLPF